MLLSPACSSESRAVPHSTCTPRGTQVLEHSSPPPAVLAPPRHLQLCFLCPLAQDTPQQQGPHPSIHQHLPWCSPCYSNPGIAQLPLLQAARLPPNLPLPGPLQGENWSPLSPPSSTGSPLHWPDPNSRLPSALPPGTASELREGPRRAGVSPPPLPAAGRSPRLTAS